jgi:hypothetical protein
MNLYFIDLIHSSKVKYGERKLSTQPDNYSFLTIAQLKRGRKTTCSVIRRPTKEKYMTYLVKRKGTTSEVTIFNEDVTFVIDKQGRRTVLKYPHIRHLHKTDGFNGRSFLLRIVFQFDYPITPKSESWGLKSDHQWENLGSRQVGSAPPEEKMSFYRCRLCLEEFVHFYDVTPNVLQAMRDQNISEECL